MAHLSVKVVAALALLALATEAVGAARILALMPMPSRSHHIAFSGVTKALADKGHDVTMFTGLPKGNKINPASNKLIHLDNPLEENSDDILKDFWTKEMKTHEMLTVLTEWGLKMTNGTLSSPAFQAEINKPGQKYDLILAELWFFQEGFVALGHKFNCPVVAVNPFGSAPYINDAMGNALNPAYVPSPFLGSSDRMSFTERAMNTLLYVGSQAYYNYIYTPKIQAIVDLHFPGTPPLYDLMRSKLAVTLINNHYTLGYPFPMAPNTVEIGGIHISDKPKALPKDLQEFMDSAKEGVVYFSMGSNLKVEFMPEDKKAAILGALGAIKERVLLKWDGPKPKNMPPNMKHIEWAPQGDLLAHPNLRAFFTHGGLLSTQESVYHGVPLIGMPMFGDQQFNMMLAVNKGFCVKLDQKTLTREKVDHALREVLTKPKYKEAASRLSRLFRAKPMGPTQSAVHAVEHVLQHGGDHMRPSSVGMPLYQLLMLDLLAVAALPFLLLFWCCCRSKKQSGDASVAAKKKKKNN